MKCNQAQLRIHFFNESTETLAAPLCIIQITTAHYDAVIITTHNTDYIIHFICGMLAMESLTLLSFYPLGSAFVAHTEPFGVIFMRSLTGNP